MFTSSTPTKATGRIGALDVIRGVAVLLVMLRHAWPDQFGGGGIVGVTLFFTLSGYLITGIIVKEVSRTGTLSFRRFYQNRALRLLPALGLLLVVFVAVEAVASPFGGRGQIVPTVLVGLFYVADQPFIPVSPGMGHIWTLSVEEQFYFVWPALVILGVRRGWLGRIILTALVGWLVVCAVSLVLVAHHGGPGVVYELPTSWAEALIVGAALAVYRDRLQTPPWWLAAVAGVVLVALAFVPDAKGSALTYLAGGPVIAISAAVLILFALARPPVAAWVRPLLWLGLISYATYLWNYPVIIWLQAAFGVDVWTSVLSIPLTVAAAVVSWFTVERVAGRFKARMAVQRERSSDPVDHDRRVADGASHIR